MATAYHRDQPGAPALITGGGQSGQQIFATFRSILIGCLVAGYEGCPAAGWELIAESSSILVLRNGNHSGYVQFSYSAGQIIVYLSAGYSGPGIGGDGLRSGMAASNAIPQSSYVQYLGHPATGWSLVADANTFIFSFTSLNGAAVELAGAGAGTYSTLTLYVGEDSSGNFVSMGGRGTTSVTSNRFAYGATCLYDPRTGLLAGNAALPYTPNIFGVPVVAASGDETVQLLPTLDLSRIYWGLGNESSFLRGICSDTRLLTKSVSKAMQCIGSAPVTTLTAGLPVVLYDGYSYLPSLRTQYDCGFFLITNNPAFW